MRLLLSYHIMMGAAAKSVRVCIMCTSLMDGKAHVCMSLCRSLYLRLAAVAACASMAVCERASMAAVRARRWRTEQMEDEDGLARGC